MNYIERDSKLITYKTTPFVFDVNYYRMEVLVKGNGDVEHDIPTFQADGTTLWKKSVILGLFELIDWAIKTRSLIDHGNAIFSKQKDLCDEAVKHAEKILSSPVTKESAQIDGIPRWT